jgi:hypothetical protein
MDSARIRCHRCLGLMCPTDLSDWESGTGQDTCRAFRCLTCGDIIDYQILHNRFINEALRRSPFRSRARHHVPAF